MAIEDYKKSINPSLIKSSIFMANCDKGNSNSPPEYQYSRSIPPPPYFTVFVDLREQLPVDALPTQHEFIPHGEIFKPKPWATLCNFSRPLKVIQKHPIFFGGDIMMGMIGLKLNNQVINSILIIVEFLGLLPSNGSDKYPETAQRTPCH